MAVFACRSRRIGRWAGGPPELALNYMLDRRIAAVGESAAEGIAELRGRHRRGTSRFLDVSGVELHLLDEGKARNGLTVLLLSAQWLGVSHGDRWAPLLAARHRVIRIDLPGQGLSGRFPDGDYSAAGYARLIADIVQTLGIGRRVVVGTSFSGIAATLYAATSPPGLCGLVLATSSGLPRDPGGASPGAMPADPALAAVGGRLPRAFYDWKMGTLLRRPMPEAAWARLVDEAHAMNELPGRAAEAARRVAQYDAAELSAALPRVAVPVLVQWSSDSTYLPASMAERIAALVPGQASVRLYPDTGHLLIADAPEETARDVALFLEQCA